jgi:hypothetical protein
MAVLNFFFENPVRSLHEYLTLFYNIQGFFIQSQNEILEKTLSSFKKNILSFTARYRITRPVYNGVGFYGPQYPRYNEGLLYLYCLGCVLFYLVLLPFIHFFTFLFLFSCRERKPVIHYRSLPVMAVTINYHYRTTIPGFVNI